MSAFRESLRLAWPLILSNISVPLLGMVDTAVVGHLPEAHALGGVALGANLVSIVYFLLGFLRMGTTGLTAQALGSGDGEEVKAGLLRALMIGAGLGVVMLATAPLIAVIGRAVFAPTPAVSAEFDAYLAIRLLGAPLALANMTLLGWMLGMQDSRGPLILLVFTNGLNAFLDMVLVWGLGMTADGVALATIIAEAGGLGLGLLLIRPAWRKVDAGVSRKRVLDLARFRRLFSVNRDLFLRSLVLEAAFLAFLALGARQGELVLATNAVLFHFFTFAAYGLDGFAFAAEAMVGRAVGARNVAAFKASVAAGFANAALLAAATGLAFWLIAPVVIDLLTGIEAVRQSAKSYRLAVALIPPIAVWAFLFDGIFIGAMRTAELRNAMALSLAVFLGALAVLVPAFANPGLWAAFLLFLAGRGAILALIYWRADRGAAFARG